jgi:hypothetical protein
MIKDSLNEDQITKRELLNPNFINDDINQTNLSSKLKVI